MTEDNLLSLFRLGVKPKTRVQLDLNQVTNINEAYILASKVENVLDLPSSNYIKSSKNFNFKNSKNNQNLQCHYCKMFGHLAKNCNKKQEFRTQNHFRFSNNNKTNNNGNNNNSNNITTNNNHNNKSNNLNNDKNKNNNNRNNYNKNTNNKPKCRKCGKFGHYASHCHSQQVNNICADWEPDEEEVSANFIDTIEGEIFYFSNSNSTLKINGIVHYQNAEICIDCGATSSIMSSTFALKHKIFLNPSNIMIKLANSKTEFVKGKTNPLPVRLGTSNVNLEFIVIDHKDHDILLGLDWFKLTKAGIFPSTNIIIFPNSDKVNKLENNDLRDLYQIDDESIYQVDSLDDETVKFYEEESSWSFNEVTIKPEIEFSEEDKPKLTFLIEASKTLFAKNAKELGTCKIIEHEI